jgi:aspartyl-tRNA(Asn)/glutamyl-tRNA(Gln) amidotransferase subunit A
LNARINAFVSLSDTAVDDARLSAQRHANGSPLSPLDGMPIAIKDNLAVRGMPTTWGCPHYADFTPEADELPVARLRDAGLIIIGKTNVPEFTLEGYTGNTVFGTTCNPWNTDLTPGGSSGGSVAAVAAGLVPLALGTDGGGSTRRPAAFTGLVGLKPSIGTIARGGGLPQILLDFEVIGPIARTVADLALLFDVLADPDRRDHRSRRSMTSSSAAANDPLRILYAERFGDAPLDPIIGRYVSSAADSLAELGYVVERGPLPFDIETVNQFWPTISMVGLAKLTQSEPAMRGRASPKYVEMADRGNEISAATFLAGQEEVWALRNQCGAAFQEYDIIMTPSCAAMPWPAAEAYPPHIDGQKVGPRGHAVYTGWVNACGHPGINLPAAQADNGMPIGFQLVGDIGADPLLIDVARRYEAAHPWADRWPDGF